MPESDNLISHIYVQLDGAEAPEEFSRDLLEVSVENSLHLPDVATLILHDTRLHWIDEASLLPGKSIKITAKTIGQEKLLFDGEIVELEPDFAASTQRLIVRAFDRLHRLSRGYHVRSFLNVSDGDLIQKIAQEVGLQAEVGPTTQVHAYVFQNDETNLEFLQGRAAALGYLLYVQEKVLHCDALRAKGQPIELEWGLSLREFRPRLTTLGQVQKIMVRGWNPATKQEIVGQAQDGQGGTQVGYTTSGGTLAKNAFSLETQTLVADRPIRTQAAADALAQAVADKQAGHFIEAEGTCRGNPNLIAGVSVHIKAVGDRFSGTYHVSSAHHMYNAQQGYTTQFSVSGYDPSTLLSIVTRDERVAFTSGLVIGLVTDNQDPQGQGRVKVKYPWLSSDHASDWARVVVPGGGDKRGIEFLPEVDDEVLVGFEMGDIHYPYVLGGLWNGRDALPKNVISGGKVQQRIIRSRTGHMITLDDSDGGGGITIEDKNGNSMKLESEGNKFTLTVQGDVTVKAQQNVKVEAQGNVSVEAQGNLKVQAQGSVEIKGTAGVKIDGGPATVDVKGSMINLN